MKKRKISSRKILRFVGIIFLLVIIAVISSIGIYNNNLKSVSKENKEVIIQIEDGNTYLSIANKLKEANLIKDTLAYKIYIKLNKPNNLHKGTYILKQNMDVKEIIKTLEGGSNYSINVTFKEGVNIVSIAKTIAKNTNNKEEDLYNLLKDRTYIKELISTYWFLTNDILDDDIYYPLEGYLFPNTYSFNSKDVELKTIIKAMLDQTNTVLMKYKKDIDSSKYSIHEVITLASILELEAGNADDRSGVAGVFYNRLETSGWTLGSDVTTYYGSKIYDFSYSLTNKELNDCKNGYNTRCGTKKGLPVGPISNPGEESIKAALEPTSHNYFYFVADCKGKTYFSKNSTEHSNIIAKLKADDNWCA